jgi:hypothetical protein
VTDDLETAIRLDPGCIEAYRIRGRWATQEGASGCQEAQHRSFEIHHAFQLIEELLRTDKIAMARDQMNLLNKKYENLELTARKTGDVLGRAIADYETAIRLYDELRAPAEFRRRAEQEKAYPEALKAQYEKSLSQGTHDANEARRLSRGM